MSDDERDVMQEMVEALERSTAANEAALSAMRVANAKIAKLREALVRIEKARFGLDLNDLETSKVSYWSRLADEHRRIARATLDATK